MTGTRESALRNHVGFALVELLVVIAVIAVLVSILLTAVQSAREAARRTQCKSNLRQIALGIHNFETAHRTYPPGYRYRPGPQGNASGFSWGTLVLPFLEESSVYDQFSLEAPIFAAENRLPREQHLPVFLCPADAVSQSGFVEMRDERYAMASYVASFGPPDLDETQEKRDGVFSRNSTTEVRHIVDGLSKSLMAGERENGLFRSGALHGNHFQYETTWAGAVRDADDPTDDHGHMVLFQTGHTPNHPRSDDRDISAPHEGLAQFLFCDGSVRVLDEAIDFAVYTALGTRAGEETIGGF